MKKYIDSEKLTAEIEIRIESWATREKYALPGPDKDIYQSRVTELTDLLSFIDSLQAEQGYVLEGIARPDDYEVWVDLKNTDIEDGDEVIIQIRKK